jgi:hypothetical protein
MNMVGETEDVPGLDLKVFKRLNPSRHILVCANDIDLLGKNKHILQTETEDLFSAGKKICPEVNDEKASTACEQNVE